MFSDPKLLLDLAQWAVTLALALFVWLRKPGEDAGDAVRKLRDEISDALNALRLSHASAISDHAQRLVQVETHIHHMPDDNDFRAMESRVAELSAGVRNLTESLAPIRQQLSRIEEFLLNSRQQP